MRMASCSADEKKTKGDDGCDQQFDRPERRNLTIDVATTTNIAATGGPANEPPRSPAQKILLSKEDIARRARMFENCGVISPSLEQEDHTFIPGEIMASKGPYQSLNDTIEAIKNESGQQYESIARQQQTVPNPFQFPHRPIEQIQLLNTEVELERQSAKRKAQKLSPIVVDDINSPFELDDDGVSPAKKSPSISPYYERLSFDGNNVSGVPIDELKQASQLLCEALFIRAKYMALSMQSFCPTTASCIESVTSDYNLSSFYSKHGEDNFLNHRVLCAFQESQYLKADGSVWKPFEDSDIPGDNGYTFEMVDGVFQITGCKRNLSGEPNKKQKPVVHPYPCIDEFMEDQNVLLALSTHGPVKSFSYRRLQFLESKYKLHLLLNEMKELAAQKDIPHRDFYNVRKVDTHVHAASCMNQKHLLRFIKKKAKKFGDQVVCKNSDKTNQTLNQVRQSTVSLSVKYQSLQSNNNNQF